MRRHTQRMALLHVTVCIIFNQNKAETMKQPWLAVMASALCCALHARQAAERDTAKYEMLETVEIEAIQAHTHSQALMKTPQQMVTISPEALQSRMAGSLAASLDNIPGVKSMTIGSGESKPAIRGLGFNRMAVTENGIKHEGQQWGEDHGLEIDQSDVDHIEIVKGPAALLHGSDAMGGVINICSDHAPQRPFEGKVQLHGHSNNDALGGSIRLGGKSKKGFYYRLSLAGTSYADCRVPTDSIQYYSYYIKLKDRRLRNTAGHEVSGSLLGGWQGEGWKTAFRLSNVSGKSGFFANAHGLEVRLSGIDYDHSTRDVDLPCHTVNHLKLTNHTEWKMMHMMWQSNLAYQRNQRKENAEPVSHGYMPMPGGTTERNFDKHTLSGALSATRSISQANSLKMGLQAELQRNKRGGWGFIIPDFTHSTAGIYAHDRHYLADNLIVTAGVRYDLARTAIEPYRDWYKTPQNGGDSTYVERAAHQVLHFGSLTWSAGVNYSTGGWTLKSNVGKGFRTPIPKELGANGVNYHIFRYEQGNPRLDPEEMYQWDATVNWSGKKLTVQIDPFINYFANYIYLNPTAGYQEGLQVYNYSQARVGRWGAEAQIKMKWTEALGSTLQGEYLYARQLSGNKKGYTLPFSQPWSAGASVDYAPLKDANIGIEAAYTARQSEIVPPEKPTPGHWVLNATLGKTFRWGRQTSLAMDLQARNLLNAKYYNHVSYYRLIGVPEAGRNFAVVTTLNF